MSTEYHSKLFFGVYQSDLTDIAQHIIDDDMDCVGFHWLNVQDTFLFGIEVATTRTSISLENLTDNPMELIAKYNENFNNLVKSYNGDLKLRETLLPSLILVHMSF